MGCVHSHSERLKRRKKTVGPPTAPSPCDQARARYQAAHDEWEQRIGSVNLVLKSIDLNGPTVDLAAQLGIAWAQAKLAGDQMVTAMSDISSLGCSL